MEVMTDTGNGGSGAAKSREPMPKPAKQAFNPHLKGSPGRRGKRIKRIRLVCDNPICNCNLADVTENYAADWGSRDRYVVATRANMNVKETVDLQPPTGGWAELAERFPSLSQDELVALFALPSYTWTCRCGRSIRRRHHSLALLWIEVNQNLVGPLPYERRGDSLIVPIS